MSERLDGTSFDGGCGRLHRAFSVGLMALLLAASGTAPGAPAQGKIPDSPTGRMAGARLELTGSAGEEALRNFAGRHLPPAGDDRALHDALASQLRQLRNGYPASRMRGLTKTGPNSAQLVLLSTRNDRIATVTYEFDPASPHHLQSLAIEKGDGGIFGEQSHRPAPPRATPDRAPGAAIPRGMEDRLRRFVTAFNTGDAGVMLAFIDKNMTVDFQQRRTDEENRALYERLHGMIGKLQDVGLTMAGDQVRLTATTSDHGDFAELLFDIDASPPHLIRGYSVSLQKGPPDSTLPALDLPQGIDARGFAKVVDRYLSKLAEVDRFSGSVLVARSGEPLFERAYGQANRASGTPNRPDTMFDLGSITKIFTKIAIGQLLRDGRLALDDTVLERLPDYPNRDTGSRITIAHLLDHSSGLGDIFDERYLELRSRLLAPRDFFPLFAGDELSFQPGEGMQYSNAGYVLLGAIIEATSGQSYDDYIRDNIFSPAGMARSGFVRRDGSDERAAIGYSRRGTASQGGELLPSSAQLPILGCPAGSSASSAGDLLRFSGALRDGRLLGPDWTGWIYTGRPPGVAAGNAAPERSDEYELSIAGGAPGVNTALLDGGGMTVIVLANLDPPIAQEIARLIRSAAGSLAE